LEETETKDEILKSVGINLQEQKVTLFALLLFFLPRQVQQKNKKLFEKPRNKNLRHTKRMNT
jgi:hypothetical protein